MNASARAEEFAPFGEGHGPLLSGAFAPISDESTFTDLPLLHGRIPADLNGVYLRTGPNPRFAPLGRYHPFDGDGMVHAAEFRAGRVTVRNRWVRTEDWQRESEAGAAAYWGIRETLPGRNDRPLKDSANTDVIGHAGRALVLWYLCGDAYQIDPVTLRTLGRQPALAAAQARISAHAKVDAATGELMFFEYGNESPTMHYGVLDAEGRLVHRVPITLPGPRLPHDMAITQRYSVLHDLPLFNDVAAMALGRHKLAFHASLPARLGVLPRHGAGDSIRWFEFSPCYIYHVVNAWDSEDARGRWVEMIGCRYMPATDARGEVDAMRTARNVADLVMTARLWRWRMNLDTGHADEAPLDDGHNLEFPCINAALSGQRTRFAWLADQDQRRILQWSGLRKLCLDSGRTLSAWSDSPEHSWYSEPAFAAADGPESEDHGYLISFQFDAQTRRQTLDVFDARDLSPGPIAQMLLPRHVPVGFHGCWIGAPRIDGWSQEE